MNIQYAEVRHVKVLLIINHLILAWVSLIFVLISFTDIEM